MATTRLSDVIVPELWTPNFLLESPELVAFFNSGLVARDSVLDGLASGEGSTFNVRHLNDLANEAENIGNDDPSVTSTPKKTGGTQLKAVKIIRNQSWSSMDMVAALQSPDPVDVIRSRVAAYWARRYQAYSIAVLNGVLADNIANDSSDMLHVAGAVMSGDAILDARQTMGDAGEMVTGIAMHSQCYNTLRKAQLIDYLRDADANVTFASYLGLRVTVDDGLPITGTSPNFVYTSILYGDGAVAWGTGTPKTPVELERKPDSGNGEGEEIFYSRQHWIGHPKGFSYAAAGDNPSNTALAAAATWDRSYDRKQIPLAFLHTTG